MRVRMLTLGSAAMAAALFCALPAMAQPYHYSRDSSPAERAQTESLNSDAADRAHGDSAANSAARDNYNRGRADYDRGVADNALQRAAYERDMMRYNHRWHRRGGQENVLSIDFGDIAFGYQDGYWDNGHRWHAWRNQGDARGYRNHRGSNFHDWNHDRDRDGGWMRR